MSGSHWGPFSPNLDWSERLARLRSLRAIVKLRLGQRGQEANVALLRVEISGAEPDLLEAASAEFDRLPPLVIDVMCSPAFRRSILREPGRQPVPVLRL